MGKAKRANGGKRRYEVWLTIAGAPAPAPATNEWRDHLARSGERAAEAWLKYKRELPSACLRRLQEDPAFYDLKEHFDTLEAMLGVARTPQATRAA